MVQIRSLDLTDDSLCERFLTLQKQGFDSEVSRVGVPLPPFHDDSEALRASEEVFLGAFGPELMGAVAYLRTGPVVDLRRLFIGEGYRRLGLARTLIQAVIEAEGDANRVTVETTVSNTPAVALYEGLGFRQAGRYELISEVWLVCFVKTLREGS